VLACFCGELRRRAVVIEPCHRRNIRRIDVWRVRARYQCIGIRRITDNQDLDIAACVIIHRLALARENLRVRLQKILALHSGAARPGTNQQRVVTVFEGDVGVISSDDAGKRIERAVVQFHYHAFQRLQRRSYFQELQDDRLIGAQHLSGGDTKSQLITNLTGATCNCDANWIFHFY